MTNKKTIMLQNKYFYVKCRNGFALEGVTSYKIPAQLGFFGFLVSELKDYLGDYVTVNYDSSDIDFECWTSDILVTEIQSITSVGIEELIKDTTSILDGVSTIVPFVSAFPTKWGSYPGARIANHSVDDDSFWTAVIAKDGSKGIQIRNEDVYYDCKKYPFRIPFGWLQNTNADIMHLNFNALVSSNLVAQGIDGYFNIPTSTTSDYNTGVSGLARVFQSNGIYITGDYDDRTCPNFDIRLRGFKWASVKFGTDEIGLPEYKVVGGADCEEFDWTYSYRGNEYGRIYVNKILPFFFMPCFAYVFNVDFYYWVSDLV